MATENIFLTRKPSSGSSSNNIFLNAQPVKPKPVQTMPFIPTTLGNTQTSTPFSRGSSSVTLPDATPIATSTPIMGPVRPQTISKAPVIPRAPIVQIAQALLPKNIFKAVDRDFVQPINDVKKFLFPTFSDQMVTALEENPKRTVPELVTRAKKLDVESGLERLNDDTLIDPFALGGAMRRVGKKAVGGILGKAKEDKTLEDTFKNFEDLSTKTLAKLEGRTTVSKQFISDLTNSPDLKQPERELFRKMLEGEGDQINVKDFANKVKSELLPLTRINPSGKAISGDISPSEFENYQNNRYENINLPEELRGPVANYSEHIYNSPIKTSAGNVHFGGNNSENYFAHSRIEDLPVGETKIKGKDIGGNPIYELADQSDGAGGTRRVIEIQSDLFQKGRLEGEFENVGTGANRTAAEKMAKEDPKSRVAGVLAREKEIAKLEPYRNTWHERLIREEVKRAAIDGKTKLQFPTGETAMKIEGLVNRSDKWVTLDNKLITDGSNFDVGDLITHQTHEGVPHDYRRFLVTKNNKDGTFRAVDNLSAENDGDLYRFLDKKGYLDDGIMPSLEDLVNVHGGDKEMMARLDKLAENLSAQNTVDKNNPIYRFYEKEVGKYLTNKYGAQLVTDPQGVKWWEIDLKGKGGGPVEAFGGVAGVEEDEEGNMKLDPLKTALGIAGMGALRRIKFRKGTTEAFQRADSEVTTEMLELSRPGKRGFLDHDATRDSNVYSIPSTFPKWIPEHLRSSDLFESTLKHYEAETIPTGIRQKELLEVVQQEVKDRALSYGDVPMPHVRQMSRSKEIPSLEATARYEEARLAQREVPSQRSPRGQQPPRQPSSLLPSNSQKGLLSSTIPNTPSGRKLTMGRKFITGGEKILRESGPSGRKMAQIMDIQRTKEDLLTGRYTVRINKALAGLSKEERLDVTKVLEGARPMNDKVAKASSELRTWLDEVATKAEADRFEMKTSKGGTVPFKRRENYYPRQYDFDALTKGKKREQALEHLVETGQARNLAEAEDLLEMMIQNAQRRAGNLENPRMLDLPGYEADPKVALPRYAQSVAKRFTEADAFGKKDEKIADLIKGITNEKGDYKEAQRIFDFTVDGAPKNKLVSIITQFNVVTKLSLSFILNATQSINTFTKFGIKNTAKGIWRGFTKEGKELAALQNVYDDFILVKEGGFEPAKVVKGVMYIFKKVEHFNRRTATNAGHYAIPELVQRLKKDPQSGYAIRQLESLGIDIEKALNGKLTDDDLMFGANKAIQKTQFKVDPLDLPPSWKTPQGRLLTQFKSFTFMQTKFVRDEVLKEARHGNFVPLVTFVALAVPASYLVSKIRNKLTGRSEDDDTKIDIRQWDKWMKAFGTIPTDLLIQGKFLKDTFQSDFKTPLEKGARALGTFFGPTADEAGKLMAGAEQIPRTQEKNKYLRRTGKEQDPYLALKRQGVEKVPFVGQYLKNKFFGYPKSTTTPEKKALNQDVYGFADEMAQLPFGSEEAKAQTRAYIEAIQDEGERKRQAYILSQNGIDMKGISTSDRMILGRPLYDEVQKLIDENKQGDAEFIASQWTDEQKEAYKAVKSAETTKRTETLKELLEIDPKEAIEYARSLRPDQQENLRDFLTRKGNEEWMEKYQQAKLLQ